MARTRFGAILAAVAVGMLAQFAGAAVVAPAKDYVKTDEPIVVKFLNEKGDEGKKALQTIGLPATKLDGLFGAAAAGDVVGADGKPAFTVVGADGKALMAAGDVKVNGDGAVDLSGAYPQLKEGGTYYLLWKDAPQLVITCLYNPGRGAADLKRLQTQLQSLPAADRKEALARFGPVVIKMELAEIATITTDKGVIKAKFSYEAAPHTIDNFTTLAREGFYDGSVFHRIIKGFMIQGGDAYTNGEQAGTGGPGYEIMHEFSEKKHERGTLSMARAQDPDSAGSQFFIMHAKTTSLDNQYSAFGDVIDGIDVVDLLANTPTTGANGEVRTGRPKIVSIRITPATAEQYGLKK